MPVLAIDTALAACSAAVLDTDAGRIACERIAAADGARSRRSFDAADRTRDARGVELDFAALDRIAVTTGPGSFTGLRVAISAARGIGLAAGKPVVGLTTLSAYAAPLVAQAMPDPILSAIDARHDQVYFQLVGGDGSMLLPAGHRTGRRCARKSSRFGSPHLVGNAAQLLADRCPAHALPPLQVDTQPAPDIAWVAWLGAAANPDKAHARPLYLRPPDAKPQVSQLPHEPASPS